MVSKIPGVEKSFIRDGNVHCIYKTKHYKLTSPDDIFNELGIELTADMMKELGLGKYT